MLIIQTRRAVLPEGIEPCVLLIEDGRITRCLPGAELDALIESRDDAQIKLRGRDEAVNASEVEILDVGDAVVMPGVVDTHVHINEPGRTHWEGFETATKAAAAGGITTLVEMPLNAIPPTTTVEGLRVKLDAARGKCHVDLGLWGGIVPGNQDELRALLDAGVLGFKCFLIHSGVDEFPSVNEAELRIAMQRLADCDTLVQAHAEVPGPVEAATAALPLDDEAARRSYANYLASRPPAAERGAIEMALSLCQETGVRLHIVHLADADSLETLRAARAEGLPVSVETCPHYVCLYAEEIPDGATAFKCAPPIRERANNQRLWQALEDGDIDMIVTDHSPSPPELKKLETGDFFSAWGGIASLQLSLPLVWSAARERGVSLSRVAQWMCAAPARLAGLQGFKGALVEGRDADLVIWRPEETFTVDPEALYHRHPVTPYAGRTLHGVVERTYVRGHKVFERADGSEAFADTPKGRWITRGDTQSEALRQLNDLSGARAEATFQSCCGARRWFQAMAARRSFASLDAMLEVADALWAETGSEDWLEAFSAHPRIGERKAAAAATQTSKDWSKQEQASTTSAAQQTLDALAEVNQAYEEKFGFIYIICATGKGAEEMLGIARERLENDRETELRAGAAEQHKITRLRLEKLLS